MLNGSIVNRDALGRIVAILPGVRVFFNGGTPLGSLGDIQVQPAAVVPSNRVYVGGLSYDNEGHLYVDGAGAIERHVQGGLPITATGALASENEGVPVRFVAGIPISASGRVCGVTPVAPTDLFAFNSAFSDAYDVEGL